MYSATTKVIHVNEIANVPSTLVAQARLEGKAWSLRQIPAGKGHPVKVITSRIQDLFRWQQDRRSADLIHLHYATNGYYGWGRKPLVLHLHGSDVRRDWAKPGLRQVISASLRRADAVLCATPDLLPWVRSMRPDAVWMPNPLPLEFFAPAETASVPGRVVFSSRWDDTKGLDVMVPLAKLLVQSGVEVHGLDWGTHVSQAREMGVILHPLMPLPQFSQFLASADLVVGQLQFAAMSMTDYQTLALGRRLLRAHSAEQAPAATVAITDLEIPEDTGPDLPRNPKAIAQWIVAQLAEADTPETSRQRRDWVFKHHHPQSVIRELENIYRLILS